MNGPSRLMVVAGEASGDEHAAAVVRRLRDVEVRGMGGEALLGAGAQLEVDLRHTTGMGLTEVIGRVPALARALGALASLTRRWRPEAALLVDSPDFNFPLGRWLRARGVPTVGLVAPQFWAWRPGRLQRLPLAYDKLACVLPFEVSPLRLAGVDAHFVGHPAAEAAPIDRGLARQIFGLSESTTLLALLPGSRPAELARMAPPMIEAARRCSDRLGGELSVILPLPSSVGHPPPVPPWISVVAGGSAAREALAAADVALVTSGTATLEAALLGTPQVTAYRLSVPTFALARVLFRGRFVALPNIVLRQPVVPELLQSSVTAEALSTWALLLLRGGDEARRQREAAARLRVKLAGPGASATTATMLEEILGR